MIALVVALLMQATAAPPPTSGDPIPGVPNTATEAAKPKHDTVKNAIGNVKAASDPIPGVDTPSPGPHGGKAVAQPPPPPKPKCVPTPDKPCVDT